MTTPTTFILEEIAIERQRQTVKWGVQCHSPHYWLCILMEEIGEAAKSSIADTVSPTVYRKELIHVAAVAVAAIEDWNGCQSAVPSNEVKNTKENPQVICMGRKASKCNPDCPHRVPHQPHPPDHCIWDDSDTSCTDKIYCGNIEEDVRCKKIIGDKSMSNKSKRLQPPKPHRKIIGAGPSESVINKRGTRGDQHRPII